MFFAFVHGLHFGWTNIVEWFFLKHRLKKLCWHKISYTYLSTCDERIYVPFFSFCPIGCCRCSIRSRWKDQKKVRWATKRGKKRAPQRFICMQHQKPVSLILYFLFNRYVLCFSCSSFLYISNENTRAFFFLSSLQPVLMFCCRFNC